MKCLSLDIGAKKTGFAISDDTGSIAMPLFILPTKDLIENVEKILIEKKITHIILSKSLNFKGEPNNIFEFQTEIENLLQKKYKEKIEKKELEIIFEKEFFTSKHARQEDGRKDIDDRAAALILQRFLDREKIKKEKYVN